MFWIICGALLVCSFVAILVLSVLVTFFAWFTPVRKQAFADLAEFNLAKRLFGENVSPKIQYIVIIFSFLMIPLWVPLYLIWGLLYVMWNEMCGFVKFIRKFNDKEFMVEKIENMKKWR